MNKGLEALERYRFLPTRIDYDIIEQELKQAEEDRKMLDIFKNALTIEHHEYPTIEHDENIMSYFVKELYTIRQNELEKNMRKALREWVLKNAFPKELKALEIIKKRECIFNGLREATQEEYDLLKEVMLCQSEENH